MSPRHTIGIKMNRYDILKGVELKKSLCGHCGEMKPEVKRRRLCTAYVEEESNLVESCFECYIERNDYWIERWMDYYCAAL